VHKSLITWSSNGTGGTGKTSTWQEITTQLAKEISR